ncbi:MAG TPA: universal stress protein [Candidatus Limnocylindria bacterium]|jgi:nucleotide-binding universal stress UspA family protein
MRVVIGIDGSAVSLRAHELVASTPWPHGSMIRLLGVPEPGVLAGEMEAILDGLAEPLRRRGYAAQVRVARGLPADLLLAAGRELQADLIVVGNRGRGPAASALLGSVSAVVADHAVCPVLVARAPRVSRILLATDGSASARAIPPILARWGVFRHAPVDVLSVARGKGFGGEAFVTPWAVVSSDQREGRDGDLAHHRQLAEDVAAELSEAGWRAEPLVRRGEPAEEIVGAASDLASDMIITGSRGLGDLQRLLVGSVAHHVLVHSRCSVLVMRGTVHADARQPARLPLAVLTPAG